MPPRVIPAGLDLVGLATRARRPVATLDALTDPRHGPGEFEMAPRRLPVDGDLFTRIAVGHGMARELPGGVEARGEPGHGPLGELKKPPVLWVFANSI